MEGTIVVPDNRISDAAAIALAETAIAGKAARASDAPVTVERYGSSIIITFVHVLPPETLGSDYDAQVTISDLTGEVIDLKVGA